MNESRKLVVGIDKVNSGKSYEIGIQEQEMRGNSALKDFIIYWLPPLFWMGFIFPTNSALNTNSTSHTIVPILRWLLPYVSQETIHFLHIAVRKTTHIFNYAFLTFLWYRAFRGKNKIRRTEWIFYAGAIAVGYGALDEFAQTFIPSRTGSVYDWLIDSAGVLLLCGIISVTVRSKTKETSASQIIELFILP